jgi:hypothetical protein
LFGEDERRATPSAPALSVLQAMEILERIADRRAQHVGVSLGFVERIQLLP